MKQMRLRAAMSVSGPFSKGGSHRPAFKETRAALLSFRCVFSDPLLDTVGDVLVIALEHHGMAVAFDSDLGQHKHCRVTANLGDARGECFRGIGRHIVPY